MTCRDVQKNLSNNTATLILEGGGSVLETKLRVGAGSGALGGWDESRTLDGCGLIYDM